MTSILTHVPVGPTPEANRRKIAGRHFRVDIRIGMIGGDNTMSLSSSDKRVDQHHGQ